MINHKKGKGFSLLRKAKLLKCANQSIFNINYFTKVEIKSQGDMTQL